MALSDYLGIVRRRWHIILATALACAALAWAYTSTIPTVYVSTTRMYVSMATGTSVNDSYQGGLAAQQRITSGERGGRGPRALSGTKPETERADGVLAGRDGLQHLG